MGVVSAHVQNKVSYLIVIMAVLFYPSIQSSAFSEEMMNTFDVATSPFDGELELAGYLDSQHTQLYQYELPAWWPERRIEIKNVGDKPVENIRLIFNDERNWYDFESFMDEITRGAETDLEKAMSVYWFFYRHSRHFCGANLDLSLPAYFHSFGFACCNNIVTPLGSAMASLGFPHRNSRAINHAVHEYWIDGKFRHLDADIKVFYLDRDNLEPAGINEVRADPYLGHRVPHYRSYDPDAFPPNAKRNYSPYRVMGSYTRQQINQKPTLAKPIVSKPMNLRLRPGESFIFDYSISEPNPYIEAFREKHNFDLRRILITGLLDMQINWDNGEYPFVTLTNLRYSSSSRALEFINPAEPGLIKFPVYPTHALSGFDLKVTGDQLDEISMELDDKRFAHIKGKGAANEWILTSNSALTPAIPGEIGVEITIRPHQNGSTPAIQSLNLLTRQNITRFSAPRLRLGRNVIRYSDANNERRVSVAVHYETNTTQRPPHAPQKPLYPPDGETIQDSRIIFNWNEPIDPDSDRIDYYYFQLSEYADMRYPLSASFNRYTFKTLSRHESFYQLPFSGMLHPGKTYFWRVRAVDDKRSVSDWSPVWSFTPNFPGPVADIQYRIEDDEIYLQWKEPRYGEPATAYRVYGSDEFGFVPSDQPRERQGWSAEENVAVSWDDYLLTDWDIAPANFFKQTIERRIKVVSNDAAHPNMNKLFYRVVALDKFGNRGVASAQVELPEAFIYTHAEIRIVAGSRIDWTPGILRYYGQQYVKTADYYLGLWDQPTYSFRADGLPKELSMDASTGRISGDAPLKTTKFTLKVLKNNKEIQSKAFKIIVDPPS